MQAADISAYSRDGSLQMVAEVQSRDEGSAAYAAQFRQNLLKCGAVPNAPYFAIVFPGQLFLWDRSARGLGAPPRYSATIRDVLREYLGALGEHPERLGEESLLIGLTGWLSDLANAVREPRSDADRVILDSGLYSAIQRGTVTYDVG